MRTSGIDYADMEDADLADLFRAGDSGAVRFIATKSNQQLFRAAWAVLRDSTEAEDAVQSAYLKAFAAIDTFEGRSKLSTWLTRIVINEALTRRRAARRQAPLVEEAEAVGAEAGRNVIPSSSDDQQTPEQHVANVQLHQILEQALRRLPDIYRTVFILREIEGLSVDETAMALGILPATVKTRFFRARQMLKVDLASVDRTAVDCFLTFAGAACSALTTRLVERIAAQTARSRPSFD